ncbi:hypothetical protein H0266_11125 [Halobacillus locisalis]|uniref:Uncharacterized protein n=1 Tax=Halobacillus locisalis TaxID=220753 RepID=A0A838CV06_9BACI|nr:hypothetical protein [Halobacillus locisalis]MBA2175446.1 hypothetical protein [Halobacillus locisalis]
MKFVGLILLVLFIIWINSEITFRKGYIRIRFDRTFRRDLYVQAVLDELTKRGRQVYYESGRDFRIDGQLYTAGESLFIRHMTILEPI